MICFLGTSHAANHLREAARDKGLRITNDPEAAYLIFISEDTPTDSEGNRNLSVIRELVEKAKTTGAQLVLTSQVPPGFTRSLNIPTIYHQPETLRIKDAAERARHPDYIVVGCEWSVMPITTQYRDYLMAFQCPVLMCSWEEAEFSKIAVNMMLAGQVDRTNMLAEAAGNVGARWEQVARILKLDKRIGPEAYLTPGRWQDSPHLMRDYKTLCTL